MHNKGYKNIRKGISGVVDTDSKKSNGNGLIVDDDTGANDPNGYVQKRSK